MTWEQALLTLCSVSVPVLGWATFTRGRKADEVLDVAANVKATFEAQVGINTALTADLGRVRMSLRECEEHHHVTHQSLTEAHELADAQAREIARLKATVDEHEQTIARHELTINQLRAGTAADRRGPDDRTT